MAILYCLERKDYLIKTTRISQMIYSLSFNLLKENKCDYCFSKYIAIMKFKYYIDIYIHLFVVYSFPPTVWLFSSHQSKDFSFFCSNEIFRLDNKCSFHLLSTHQKICKFIKIYENGKMHIIEMNIFAVYYFLNFSKANFLRYFN